MVSIAMQDKGVGCTDPVRVISTTQRMVFSIVQVVDILKDNDPANPCTRRVQNRLERILDAVVLLDARLDGFRYMTPGQTQGECEQHRDDVDDHGEVP